MKELGLIKDYVWGYSVEEIAKFIYENGPVVMGSNWYASMSTPDQNWRLHTTYRSELCVSDTDWRPVEPVDLEWVSLRLAGKENSVFRTYRAHIHPAR